MNKLTKKNKIILISGISVASLALIAAIVSSLIPRKAPDPKQLGPVKKVSYMASKEFARLPEKEKEKYMAKAGHSPQAFMKLSEPERRQVFKNTRKIMHKRMKENMNKFFQMSKEEQNKRLDQMIAQWDRRRREMAARRPPASNTGNRNSNGNNNNRQGPPRGNFRAMMQGILENTDSTSRAQMAEFFRRLHERRMQTQGKK